MHAYTRIIHLFCSFFVPAADYDRVNRIWYDVMADTLRVGTLCCEWSIKENRNMQLSNFLLILNRIIMKQLPIDYCCRYDVLSMCRTMERMNDEWMDLRVEKVPTRLVYNDSMPEQIWNCWGNVYSYNNLIATGAGEKNSEWIWRGRTAQCLFRWVSRQAQRFGEHSTLTKYPTRFTTSKKCII